MKDYRKLIVWEKAHQLTLEIYGTLGRFPKDEMFGLISQMKRSSASIPTILPKAVEESRKRISTGSW